MNKTPEKCIANILKDAEKRKTVDYGDRNSVRRFNAAMDRIHANLNYIDENFPDQIGLVVELLDSPESGVSLVCAIKLLDFRSATPEHKQKALQTIRRIMDDPSTDKITRFALEHTFPKYEELAKA
jgi:hypothetical protein